MYLSVTEFPYNITSLRVSEGETFVLLKAEFQSGKPGRRFIKQADSTTVPEPPPRDDQVLVHYHRLEPALLLHWLWSFLARHPSTHWTLTQCCFNVDTPLRRRPNIKITLGQRLDRVCWDALSQSVTLMHYFF